jgi:hypothetical protein
MAMIEDILRRMVGRGWKPGGPSTDEAIARVEAEYDITFPTEYRTYLRLAGGGEATAPEAYTGLWPIQILSVLNRRFRIPWNFPGLFGIGNDGFLVYAFDFRGEAPVIASLGLSSSTWEDVVEDAPTFSEWLERRMP